MLSHQKLLIDIQSKKKHMVKQNLKFLPFSTQSTLNSIWQKNLPHKPFKHYIIIFLVGAEMSVIFVDFFPKYTH